MIDSACFISSMDCFLMNFASFSYFQFSHISACRKYWLMAVSSSRRASCRWAITFGFPFMVVTLLLREDGGRPHAASLSRGPSEDTRRKAALFARPAKTRLSPRLPATESSL